MCWKLVLLCTLTVHFWAWGGYDNVTSLDWSPKGDQILFTHQGQLYIGDAPSGANHVALTSEPSPVDWGRFSPDGDWVTYVTAVEGGYKLWQHMLADNERRELHFSSRYIGQPTVDPSRDTPHTRIAFVGEIEATRGRGTEFALFLMDLESSRIDRIMSVPWPVATPDFSHDGRLVVFVGLWEASWDLFVLDIEREEFEQLTEDGYFNWCPRFSPGDRWIAFESRRNEVSHIYVIRREGTDLTRVTLAESDEPIAVSRNAFPSWSPEADVILYASLRFGGWVFLTEGTE